MDENKAHYVAATGIIIKDGKYLITKRAEWEKAFPGKWTVPGGKLEVSDYVNKKKDTGSHWYNILENLLKREVKEETGLEIKNIGYLTDMTFIRPDNIPVLIISLYAEHDSGNVELSKDMTDFAWVSLEEAKNYELIEGIYEELEMLDKKLKGEEIGEWKKFFRVIDEVYGEEIIKEPVLVELINSKLMQRLKKISQYGIPDEYYHKNNYSRYEHSIGVLILLRRLGADLNEQIAGLLHDISHTAFSHVVDWAIGDSTKEDYQDKNYLNIIENSDIPFILRKYGFNYKNISNLEDFSLLEKEAPSLCADRIDYTLRELFRDGNSIKNFIVNLRNNEGSVVFIDKEVAEKFAYEYLRLQNEHWAGPQAKVRYFILGNVLRRALENKLITVEDLSLYTDEDIIKKLEESFDDVIIQNLNLLKNGLKIEETDNCEGVLIKKKFRYIDPEILIDGEINRVSRLSENYALILEKEKRDSKTEKRYIYNGI